MKNLLVFHTKYNGRDIFFFSICLKISSKQSTDFIRIQKFEQIKTLSLFTFVTLCGLMSIGIRRGYENRRKNICCD